MTFYSSLFYSEKIRYSNSSVLS